MVIYRLMKGDLTPNRLALPPFSLSRGDHGLRALSQRVERLLRTRREEAVASGSEVVVDMEDDGGLGDPAAATLADHDYSRSSRWEDDEELVRTVPRPDDNMDNFDSRWRGFFNGIGEKRREEKGVPFFVSTYVLGYNWSRWLTYCG